MAWRTFNDLNDEMVKNFKQMSLISSQVVEDAFLNVPRAAFLPECLHDEAYADYPVRGDDHLHMSAPTMYATVLEALDLKEGMSFLNVGSGTGYFSMLVGYIVGTHGLNHGVELRANLVEHANECCEDFFTYNPKLKKTICYPQFIAGNCFHVDQTVFKYDRVYCGAACPSDKFNFLMELLKPGGLVIVPSGKKLLKLERLPDSGMKENVISDVCFESLVLPVDGEYYPILRFSYVKQKAEKMKIYPCPGLLVPKTVGRKTTSRMRSLQDVIATFSSSGCIPRAFAYVPLFSDLPQLRYTSRVDRHVAPEAVDQTVNFFKEKTKEAHAHVSKESKTTSKYSDVMWNDLQHNLIWENVVEYSYSLCRHDVEHEEKCFQLFAKVNKHCGRKQQQQQQRLSDGDITGLLSNVRTVLDKYQFLSEDEKKATKSETCSKQDHTKQCNDTMSVASLKPTILNDGFSSSNQLEETCSEITRVFEQLETCDDMLKTAEKAINAKKNVMDCDVFSGEKCLEKLLKHPGKTLRTKVSGKHRGKKIRLCPIPVDLKLTNELQALPGSNWSCDEDTELVQLLVKCLGGATSKVNSKCQSKHITVLPTLFSPASLVRYPKISSYPPESLTFRALGLMRVVHVIDHVIPFLCSTTINTDLLTTSQSENYPLLSFTDTSFAPILSSNDQSSPSVEHSEVRGEENEDVHFNNGLKSLEKRKECLEKKLHLRQTLTRRLKEQQSLIKKQMLLYDGQSNMLQRIEIQAKDLSPRQLEQLHVVQERFKAYRSRRNNLVTKQTEILEENNKNDAEIATLQKQLETLVVEEENLKQFIGNLDRITRKTRPPSRTTQSSKPYFSWTPRHTSCISNAHTILHSLRFLLPLSNRRAGILTELLRATEQPLPEQAPVVYIDRRTSVKDRLENPQSSVFYQILESLKCENLSFRWNKRKCDQWWEVKFVGEGIIDQGGGFRDSLSEISDELCPQDVETNATLPLLVKSVNNRDQVGDHRDCFVPNPSCRDLKAFHWLGKLMGAAYRSDESLALFFPQYVWKLLVGEHVTWNKDFVNVDALAVNMINNLEMIKAEEFETMYGNDLEFTTARSDGSVINVKDHCCSTVHYESISEYCQLVKKARMMESIDQLKALRAGILTVIPQSLLELVTSQELERGICGFTEISISLLKESIHYGDDLSAESECVLQLWKVLENFSADDRSRFLRFVTGRKRLPACITLSQMCGEIDTLPGASTCASTLMLPSYSSVEVAEKKLRYAIYNCIAIDTDTSPW